MSWNVKGQKAVTAGIEQLRGWDVNSLWHAGDYLVFYIDRAPQAYGLAFWETKKNTWYKISSSDIAFLSRLEYGAVSFGQIDSGVILKSPGTSIAFFPGKRTWALLQPAVEESGRIPPDRVSLLAEDLVKEPFRKAFPTVEKFITASAPLMVELPKGGGKEAYFCFCAEMILSKLPEPDGRMLIVEKAMSAVEKELALEQFGCFLVPQHVPERIITLGFFPSSRGGDYRGECMGVNSENVVLTRGIGDSYGDQQIFHGYKLNTASGKVEVLAGDRFHIPKEMIFEMSPDLP
jgi:hypothetical protein